MAMPWEMDWNSPQPAPAPTVAPSAMPWEQDWSGAAPVQAAPAPVQEADKPAYSGSILPFSRDQQGNVSFDSNAGILGAAKRAFLLPSDVYQGKVDPNSDEAIGRAVEFATMASPASAAAGAGERAVAGVSQALRSPKLPVPGAEALKDAASAGYDRVRDMGVDYSATAVRGLAGSLRANLEGDGILGELAPKSFQILSRLETPPEGSVAPIASVEAARRAFGNAAKDFNNPTDQEAARRIVAGLDGFIERADPKTVVAGPAAEAGRALQDARGNYAASKRSDTLTGIADAAELRAAVANSGQNLDNATRQRLASLILNRKASRGFNADEKDAIEQVARGSGAANSLRATGNMLGGGGGLGATLTGALGGAVGSTIGGWPGAAVGTVALPAAGAAAKKVAAALTQRGLRGVDEMTRMRSPLYEEALSSAPMDAVSAQRRAAIVQAILAMQAQQGQ